MMSNASPSAPLENRPPQPSYNNKSTADLPDNIYLTPNIYLPLSVILAVLIGVVIQALLAQKLTASGMFSDDYGYLKKSIYYLRGNFSLEGTASDRQNQWGGLVYPIAISPWQLFADPDTRHRVVFFLNSLMAAITVFASMFVIHGLSQGKPASTRDLQSSVSPAFSLPMGRGMTFLISACLFTFPPLFLFTFYALTENVFNMLAALNGAVIFATHNTASRCPGNFQGGCLRRINYLQHIMLIALVVLATLSTLSRPTGIAIAIGIACALLLMKNLSIVMRLTYAALTLSASVFSYSFFSKLASVKLDVSREERFLGRIFTHLNEPADIVTLLQLTLNHSYYILLAGGAIPILAAVLFLTMSKVRDYDRSKTYPSGTCAVSGYVCYTVVASLGLLILCLVQLTVKLHLDPADANFIYGRYVDTIALLLMTLGLASFVNCDYSQVMQGSRSRALYTATMALSALMLYLALSRVANWNGNTINQAGLYAFLNMGSSPLIQTSIICVVVGLFIYSTLRNSASLKAVLLVGVITFNLWGLSKGWNDASTRSLKISHSLQGATWLTQNSPSDACVSVDSRLAATRAPGSLKDVLDIYRALEFVLYPRTVLHGQSSIELARCQYLYTLAANNERYNETSSASHVWRPIWSNKNYVVLEQISVR